MSEFRAGSIALIGKPNVGKSTLANALVGQKFTITSDKKQTTRKNVIGISTEADHQIVILDAPGIHEAHTELGKRMNAAAQSALSQADVVVFVADVHQPPQKQDQEIAKMVQRAWKFPWSAEQPDFNGIILCLNKMDMLPAEHVIENVEAYCELLGSNEYMLTCLTKRQNVDELRKMIVQHLPVGPPLYPEDLYTDQTLRSMAAEIVREKALNLTRQELPHALTAFVDEWNEDDDQVRINASIIVEKSGQKAIIIGKSGQMIKEIGTLSRIEIAEIIGKKVHLELTVKVRENWRQNPRMLSELEML